MLEGSPLSNQRPVPTPEGSPLSTDRPAALTKIPSSEPPISALMLTTAQLNRARLGHRKEIGTAIEDGMQIHQDGTIAHDHQLQTNNGRQNMQAEKVLANNGATTTGKATGSQAQRLMAVGVSARPPLHLMMLAGKHGHEQPSKKQSETRKNKNPEEKEDSKENEQKQFKKL